MTRVYVYVCEGVRDRKIKRQSGISKRVYPCMNVYVYEREGEKECIEREGGRESVTAREKERERRERENRERDRQSERERQRERQTDKRKWAMKGV